MRTWDIQFDVSIGPKTRTKWDKNELVWDKVGMQTWEPSANCADIDRVDHYCKQCVGVPLSYQTGFTLLFSTFLQVSLYYERYVGGAFD